MKTMLFIDFNSSALKSLKKNFCQKMAHSSPKANRKKTRNPPLWTDSGCPLLRVKTQLVIEKLMEKDGEMALLIEMKIDDNINDADGVLLRELNAIKG